MGYFDNMEQELMDAQEEKKQNLGLEAKASKRKTDLHVTIPQSSMNKLKEEAKKRNLSMSILIQLLIDNC